MPNGNANKTARQRLGLKSWTLRGLGRRRLSNSYSRARGPHGARVGGTAARTATAYRLQAGDRVAT